MNAGEIGPYRDQGGIEQVGNQFDLIVVLHNPSSSQAELAEEHLTLLKHSKFGGIMLEPIKTRLDRETEEQELINKLWEYEGQTILLITLGGDGTATRVLRPLLSDELNHLDIVTLPIACGDANDLAFMVNGDPNQTSLIEIIENGKIRRINPIDASFIAPDGDEYTIPAFSYVGFGNTAMLSHKFNGADYRAKIHGAGEYKRLFEQGKILIRQMPKSKLEEFSIRESDGSTKEVHEITVVSGPRMAKLGKPDPGLKLTDPTLLKLTYEKGNFVKSASWMGRLALGRLPGEYLYEGDAYDFLLESDVLMHADAEVRKIDKHTFVNIQQHKRTVSIISTVL